MNMNFPEIYSATGVKELLQKIGFLPPSLIAALKDSLPKTSWQRIADT